MDHARTIKQSVPHQRVFVMVHEMKRLGRGAAELLAIAGELRRHDIEPELLSGPLQGIYHPSGHGAVLFALRVERAEFLQGQEPPFRPQATIVSLPRHITHCNLMTTVRS